MKKIIIFILLLFSYVSYSEAQTVVTGVVFDNLTNEPIEGAIISDKNNNTINTLSNSSGNFVLTSNNIIDSIYIDAGGYKPRLIAATGRYINIGLIQSAFELNEIIVSANRETQPRTEAPLTIQTISKSTINDTKATRLDMLINKISGVYMVDLGNEQHTMSIRQPINYNSVYLYLEDGIPIRTIGDFNHNALIEINQASLQKIEVIKGPASSLYGSEAIGGAINFITQSPSLTLTPKLQAEIGSRGYKRADFFISNTIKKLGFYAGGYYADQSEAENLHNNFRKGAITLRADYTFNSNSKLIATADYINYDTDQKGGLDSAHFYDKDYTSNYRFTYRKVNAFRFKTALSLEWNSDNNTNFTFLYRNTSIGQNPFYRISNIQGHPSKANGQINDDAFQSYGGIIQHSKNFDFLNAKLILGISGDFSPAAYNAKYISIDRNAQGIYSSYTETDSLLTDYKVDLLNTAAYTQFEFNPIEKMKFIAAARYDRMDYKFVNHLPPSAYTGAPSTTNNFDHFTPKVGITYGFTYNKGIYANYSVGFTPPNITELYTGVKVPFLKPSTYNNYEVGGWYGFDDGRGYFELSLYQLEGFDEIISVRQADGTYQNQNVGETRHRGMEFNLNYAPINDIYIRIGGTIAKHEYISYSINNGNLSGNEMSQAPPYIANSEVTYKPSFFKGFRIGLEWQAMGKYYTDPQNTKQYDGFNVFNARAGYQFKGLDVWVNCLNVSDEVYATSVETSAFGTSYRPGQLRTFNVGVGYYFNKNSQ
jgi:iron complex outermembrane receptor protein